MKALKEALGTLAAGLFMGLYLTFALIVILALVAGATGGIR